MPASGMPVASTITSMAGCAISACASARDMGAARLERVAERSGGDLLGRPAGGRELAVGARDIEIGDADDVQTLGQPRLRQKHGAELAGADQADGDGAAGGFAFEQQSVLRFMPRSYTGGAASPSPRSRGERVASPIGRAG